MFTDKRFGVTVAVLAALTFARLGPLSDDDTPTRYQDENGTFVTVIESPKMIDPTASPSVTASVAPPETVSTPTATPTPEMPFQGPMPKGFGDALLREINSARVSAGVPVLRTEKCLVTEAGVDVLASLPNRIIVAPIECKRTSITVERRTSTYEAEPSIPVTAARAKDTFGALDPDTVKALKSSTTSAIGLAAYYEDDIVYVTYLLGSR